MSIITFFPTESPARQFFMADPWLALKEETVALTLFGGAFPCNILLLETIAMAIVTRAQQDHGGDVVAACLQKGQYRAWQEFGRAMGHFYRASQQRHDFQICRRVARRAVKNVITLSPRIRFFVDGEKTNPTHFHHMEEHPDWAAGHTPLFAVADYYFYAL